MGYKYVLLAAVPYLTWLTRKLPISSLWLGAARLPVLAYRRLGHWARGFSRFFALVFRTRMADIIITTLHDRERVELLLYKAAPSEPAAPFLFKFRVLIHLRQIAIQRAGANQRLGFLSEPLLESLALKSLSFFLSISRALGRSLIRSFIFIDSVYSLDSFDQLESSYRSLDSRGRSASSIRVPLWSIPFCWIAGRPEIESQIETQFSPKANKRKE